MQVIAANLPAIRDLAERQDPTDLTMRRLQDFVNLQEFACLWGMVPGSLTDEASPFNECAHSYLAGARALLMHLRQMPGGDRRGVDALASRIELEMLSGDASLVLCRYSDEPFNTDEVIAPHWSENSAARSEPRDLRRDPVADRRRERSCRCAGPWSRMSP